WPNPLTAQLSATQRNGQTDIASFHLQIMDKLEAFISGNRKGIENNIRVCLSSHDCFVKVPAGPYVTQSNKNFWKVDESRITAKMARRNFKGILHQFPDLYTKVRKQANQTSEASERLATTEPPAPAICCPNIQKSKFTSSFSIESILNQKSQRSCPQNPSFSGVSTDQLLLCAESVDTMRRRIWDSPQVARNRVSCPDDSYPSCVTWGPTVHVIGDGRRTSKMMRMCVKPSYPNYFRPSVAPCFVDRYSKCDVCCPVWT
uniref:Fork-head domain-containing protein n=1 Tax=Esox lucius TaxID=8010 RepID=A0A3P8Z2A7_ESOLU